jgi:hypothetical protein
MENGKALAKEILSNLGFRVEEISTGDGRTADLRVIGDTSAYVVEVKDKQEAEQLTKERTAALIQGDLHEQSDLIARNERIRAVLKDAREQLDATPKDAGTFQLIWLHGDGLDDGLRTDQAFATFYGHVDLIGKDPPQPDIKGCLYFDYYVSIEIPTVDALILSDSKSFRVCLNEFSPRVNEFRSTELYQAFLAQNCIYDPIALVSSGKVISCRTMIQRKYDDEIAKALQEQTGVLYSPLRFTQHSVSAAVEPAED